jgi:hypothetical protein
VCGLEVERKLEFRRLLDRHLPRFGASQQARFRAGVAGDNPTYLAVRERIYDGMRKAGVPEG